MSITEADAATATQALQAIVIRQDPKMLFCPDFLNDEEIDHILALAKERWRESTVLLSKLFFCLSRSWLLHIYTYLARSGRIDEHPLPQNGIRWNAGL